MSPLDRDENAVHLRSGRGRRLAREACRRSSGPGIRSPKDRRREQLGERVTEGCGGPWGA